MKNPFPTIEARVTRAVPDVLYHYTSAEGLSGIIRQKALWAKDIHKLNDRRELLHALDMASTAIQAYKPESLSTLQVNSSILMLEYIRRLKGGKLFVASLTEAADLLSQWRAYCPPGGGFSIGFSTAALSNSPDWGFFKLYPCLYNSEEQQDLIEFLVGSYIGILQGIPTIDSREMKGLSESVAFWFVGALMRVAPLLKHQSFFEEREWRLVTMSPANRRPLPPQPLGADPMLYTQFRLGPGTTSPGTRFVVREVVVGPTEKPLASVDTAWKILEAEGIVDVDILHSGCPLRVI